MFPGREPSLENWTNVFLSFGQYHIFQVTVVQIETEKPSEKLARIIALMSKAKCKEDGTNSLGHNC